MSNPKKRSWKRLLARLTVVLFLLLFCLLLLEIGTRVVYNAGGLHFGMEMWKYARVIKRPSPIIAMVHEHTPNAQAVLMGVDVRTNSRGLRDREFSLEKPAGVTRILVLGDSMTFGWGAAQDDTYPKVLERLLNEKPLPRMKPRVEVLNTGVGNYNTSQEVAYLRERGLEYQPDLVILGFFLNDGEPTPRPTEGWLARNSAFYVLLASSWDNTLRWAGSRQDYKDYYRELYREDRPGWQECQRALRDLIDLCRERKIDLRIALIPELHKPGSGYEFQEVHDQIRDLGTKGGVPVYDLLDADWVDPPETYWVTPGDAHPNAKGHRVLAEALYKALGKTP